MCFCVWTARHFQPEMAVSCMIKILTWNSQGSQIRCLSSLLGSEASFKTKISNGEEYGFTPQMRLLWKWQAAEIDEIFAWKSSNSIYLSIHQIWRFGPISIWVGEAVVLIKALFGVIYFFKSIVFYGNDQGFLWIWRFVCVCVFFKLRVLWIWRYLLCGLVADITLKICEAASEIINHSTAKCPHFFFD